MVEVSFKGPLKKVLGIEDFQLKDGKLNDILKEISRRIGVSLELKGGKLYMRIDDAKFTISILHNGVNVLRENVKVIKGGKLEIITPLGGG